MNANVIFFDDVARTDENGRIVLPPAVLGRRNFEPNSEVPLFATDFGVELLSPEQFERLTPPLGIDGESSSASDADQFDLAVGLSFPRRPARPALRRHVGVDENLFFIKFSLAVRTSVR